MSKRALTWGGLCFILLYRTFPADVVLWWDVLQQWDIPVWQQMVTYTSDTVPALIPLGCFMLLARKPQCDKVYTVIMPFIAWVAGRFVLMIMLGLITFRISHAPLYLGGFQHLLAKQIVTMYWTSHTLVSALIIMACGHAFWRERQIRYQQP